MCAIKQQQNEEFSADVLLIMKYRNLVSDSMMVITLSYLMGNAIKINIQMDSIMNQVVMKFRSLKSDDGGGIMISSDAMCNIQ